MREECDKALFGLKVRQQVSQNLKTTHFHIDIFEIVQ